MRRRRQRLYRQPEPEPTPTSVSGPAISWREVHLDICAQWRPRSSATSITDSKRRTWFIADRNGLYSFSCERPIGAPDALYRVFWREDMVRAVYFRDGERSTTEDALMAQLRRSFRIDHPEAPAISKTESLQRLYDSRGMKPR